LFARATADDTVARFDPVLDADPFSAEAQLAQKTAAPALRRFLQGVAAAGRLDNAAAQKAFAAVFDNPMTPAPLAGRALVAAGVTAVRAQDYARGADLLDGAISDYRTVLPPSVLSDAYENRDGAMALRGQPAQLVEQPESGRVDLGVNGLGLTTAPISIEGQDQIAVIDTGADMSALSATAAKRFGVHLIPRQTITRTSTAPVSSNLAIAGTVRFGTITLHHVVFIVLDDAALSPLGPSSRIDAIIGLPVLAALGRVTFHVDGDAKAPHRSLTFSPSPRRAHPGNLRFAGFRPFVRITANGQTLPFAIDSGSNTTYFGKRYAREFPAKLVGLAHRAATTIGGGGAQKRDNAIIPSLDFAIGNSHVPMANAAIEIDGNGANDLYGTVGADVLWAKGGYTMDFGALSLTLGD
jgi:predicted aspartyl protease